MKAKIGWVLSILVTALLLFSSSGKFMGGPEVVEGMAKMGLPENILLPIGIVEVLVAVLFLIPQTALFGVILITGYMGGAILTHLRVGDAFLIQALVPIVAWIGYSLRNYENMMRLIRRD